MFFFLGGDIKNKPSKRNTCPIQAWPSTPHPQAVITKSVFACVNLATLHDRTCIMSTVFGKFIVLRFHEKIGHLEGTLNDDLQKGFLRLINLHLVYPLVMSK